MRPARRGTVDPAIIRLFAPTLEVTRIPPEPIVFEEPASVMVYAPAALNRNEFAVTFVCVELPVTVTLFAVFHVSLV